MLGLLSYKVGMIRIYNNIGEFIVTTVLQVDPCVITQKKTEDTDGYLALQLGFGDIKEKKVTKPLKIKFEKAKVTPKKFLREFRVTKDVIDTYNVGQEIKVSDLFKVGQFTDIAAISKGKGFAGVVKRHNFNRGPMAHGSTHHRAPGSIGSTFPCRVFKNKRMGGRMGNDHVTVQNLKIIKIDSNENLIYIKGAVPGTKGALVEIRPALKKTQKR